MTFPIDNTYRPLKYRTFREWTGRTYEDTGTLSAMSMWSPTGQWTHGLLGQSWNFETKSVVSLRGDPRTPPSLSVSGPTQRDGSGPPCCARIKGSGIPRHRRGDSSHRYIKYHDNLLILFSVFGLDVAHWSYTPVDWISSGQIGVGVWFQTRGRHIFGLEGRDGTDVVRREEDVRSCVFVQGY